MSGGPTNLINKSEDTVVVINEALVGVMIRFICENPRSASLEEIGDCTESNLQRKKFIRNTFFGEIFAKSANHCSFV